jgi:hypothetical protein
MGVALGGTGAGSARIRAEGGVDRLTLGAGDKDVLAITPNSVNMIGDFANQGLYQVYPLTTSWTPPASASGKTIPFPGATLTIDVPQGSKVLLVFNTTATIDSDYIELSIEQDGNRIFLMKQACYDIAGSKETWNFAMTHLDIDVTPGLHTYEVFVDQSDDADDNEWGPGLFWWSLRTNFYAVVIKE